MKIQYPDESVVRDHPPLAGLSENAVYVLLMRRRRSVRLGDDGITRLVSLAVLIVFLVAFFGPWNSLGIRLIGQIGVSFLGYIIYRIERAMKVRLSREFLGFSAEEADQYALLPISAEDVVVARWGEAALLRPRRLALIVGCGGLALLLLGLFFESWTKVLGAGILVGVAGYWIGIESNWGARVLVKTSMKAWNVRHSHTTNKERQKMRWDYRSDLRLVGWIFIPGAIVVFIGIMMTSWFTGFANNPPGIFLSGGLMLVMLGWGYVTGTNVGRAAWDESDWAFTQAIYNTKWIQHETFGREGNEESL